MVIGRETRVTPSKAQSVSAGYGEGSGGGGQVRGDELAEEIAQSVTAGLSQEIISMLRPRDFILPKYPRIGLQYLYYEPGTTNLKKGKLEAIKRIGPMIVYEVLNDNGSKIDATAIFLISNTRSHVGGKKYKKTRKTMKTMKTRKIRKTKKTGKQ
jgi:hypothetical protein